MARMKPNPNEVLLVLSALSKDQVDRIRKDNPFRNERDDMIIELIRRGVKGAIIAEISGLNDTTITRIGRRYQAYYKKAKNAGLI